MKTFATIAILILVSVAPMAQQQSLADAAKKAEEARAKAATPTKVYTNKDLKDAPAPAPEPETFTPTAEAIVACKGRSLKALFRAVDAEHHGQLTTQFADLKLRDDPALAAAAKADRDSCEKGSYIGAMEKALRGSLSTPATGQVPIAPSETTVERAAEADQRARDEMYWKGRMRVLQATLDDRGAQLAASIRTFDAMTADYEGSRGANRIVAHGRMLDAAAEMSRHTALVASSRRAIKDLEEEARVAGVPPGWLRPGPPR